MGLFTAHGQGTIQFINRLSGVVDARLVLPDGTGAGEGWTAQLYVKRSGPGWYPLNPTVLFRTTSSNAKGYVNPTVILVPGLAGGEQATFIVRAYNGAYFQTSTMAYESNPFSIVLGGGGSPPGPSAPLLGLESFTLVKVPSPKLSVLQSVSPGMMQFSFPAIKGMSYTIQTSRDLVVWTDFTTILSADSTIQFTDSSAANSDSRFYRVVSP